MQRSRGEAITLAYERSMVRIEVAVAIHPSPASLVASDSWPMMLLTSHLHPTQRDPPGRALY